MRKCQIIITLALVWMFSYHSFAQVVPLEHKEYYEPYNRIIDAINRQVEELNIDVPGLNPHPKLDANGNEELDEHGNVIMEEPFDRSNITLYNQMASQIHTEQGFAVVLKKFKKMPGEAISYTDVRALETLLLTHYKTRKQHQKITYNLYTNVTLYYPNDDPINLQNGNEEKKWYLFEKSTAYHDPPEETYSYRYYWLDEGHTISNIEVYDEWLPIPEPAQEINKGKVLIPAINTSQYQSIYEKALVPGSSIPLLWKHFINATEVIKDVEILNKLIDTYHQDYTLHNVEKVSDDTILDQSERREDASFEFALKRYFDDSGAFEGRYLTENFNFYFVGTEGTTPYWPHERYMFPVLLDEHELHWYPEDSHNREEDWWLSESKWINFDDNEIKNFTYTYNYLSYYHEKNTLVSIQGYPALLIENNCTVSIDDPNHEPKDKPELCVTCACMDCVRKFQLILNDNGLNEVSAKTLLTFTSSSYCSISGGCGLKAAVYLTARKHGNIFPACSKDLSLSGPFIGAGYQLDENSQIVKDANDNEIIDNVYNIVLIRRENGAIDAFKFKPKNWTPGSTSYPTNITDWEERGTPVNGGNRYLVRIDENKYELRFSDQYKTVYYFDKTQSATFTKVTQVRDNVELVLEGWPDAATESVNETYGRITKCTGSALIANVDYPNTNGIRVTYTNLSGNPLAQVESAYSEDSENNTGTFTLTNENDGQVTDITETVYDSLTQTTTINYKASDGTLARQMVRVRDDISDDVYTLTDTTSIPGGSSFTTITKYQKFDWDTEVIEEIEAVGTDKQKATVYGYVTDPEANGYSKLKYWITAHGNVPEASRVYNGEWGYYVYDSNHRRIKKYSPYGNSLIIVDSQTGEAVEPSSSACIVTEYDYTGVHPDDQPDDEFFNFRARSIITKILGSEVSRSYNCYLSDKTLNISCSAPGAAWNAAGNQVSSSESYPDGDAKGALKKTVAPDGLVSLYTYSSGGLVSNVNTGYSSDGATVTDGTSTTTTYNASGRVISSIVVDIASGLTISQVNNTLDGWGRITRSDQLGGLYTSTVYGCCGPDSTADVNGITTLYTYDALQRTSSTARNGISTLYTYDANDNILTTTIKGKNNTELTTTNVYNTAGELISSTAPDSSVISYSEVINADGTSTQTETHPNGTTIISVSNLDGSSKSISGTAVHPMRFEYGIENGERFTKTIYINSDQSETQWTKSYTDFLGHQYKTVYADSSYSLTEYDSAGRVIKQTSPGGIVTLTEYDNRGRIFRTAVDMNANSQIDLTVDRVTEYAYGVTTKSSATVNRRTVKSYQDGTGTPVTISVNESDVTGLQRWDTIFNQISSSITTVDRVNVQNITVNTEPGGVTITEQYTNGQLVSSTHSVLGATSYTYDEFNRQSTVSHTENSINQEVSYTYDNMGRVLTTTQMPANRVTTNVYDNMGRRTSVSLPGSRTVTYTYHDTGELATVSGSDTYPQAYTYDGLGRMKTLTTYKAYPNQPEVTTWNYDPQRGFMTSKIYADSKGPSYQYNSDGQLTKRTWARGSYTDYTYDASGSQTGIDYSDSTQDITFAYDQGGRLTTVTDAAGTHALTYNNDSTLASATIPYILNHKVDYAYDTLGRRSFMSLMNNTTPVFATSYTYDSMSRLATVSDGTNTATYTRATGSSLLTNTAITNASGTILNRARSYDNLNRLTTISNSVPSVPSVVKSYSYTYNDKDQRTKLTLADGSYWLYSYDDKGQVTGGIKYDSTGKSIPGLAFGYSFDDIGNRIYADMGMPQMRYNYTSNDLNQYTQMTVPSIIPVTGKAAIDAKVTVTKGSDSSVHATTRDGKYFKAAVPADNTSAKVTENLTINAVRFDATQDKDIVATTTRTGTADKTPQTFTYDDDGNMLTNGDWTYTWNAENRLIEAVKTNDTKLEFMYDYMGRRIDKKVYTYSPSTFNFQLSTHQKFVYDGYLQIAEFDTSNVIQKSYLWASSNTMEWQKDHTNSKYHYSMYDGNKNIIGTVDAAGMLTSFYEYSQFGKILTKSGTYADSNKFRFSSEYHDDETVLIYYNYRYYDPVLGRWIRRDPLGELDDAVYIFNANNGVSYIDVWGLKKVKKPYWKKKRNNRYEAQGDELTLKQLAKIVSKNKTGQKEKDWVCIWPEKMEYWTKYPVAQDCAIADVSNLVKDYGTVQYMIPDINKDTESVFSQGLLAMFKKAGKSILHRYTSGADAATKLKKLSGQGKTPIGKLVVAGHHVKGQGIYHDDISFKVSDIMSIADENNNSKNSPENAAKKIGPPKCWFSKNAKIYGFACYTAEKKGWSDNFASSVAREGSTVYGTKNRAMLNNNGVAWIEYHKKKVSSYTKLDTLDGWHPISGTQ